VTQRLFTDVTKQKMATLAKDIARTLKGDELILLYGNLGSGKTYFTSLLCKHLQVKSTVNSPSFVILNQYEGKYKINHYDLYRITRLEDALQIGILEQLSDAITIIEWPQIIENLLPKDNIKITFNGTGSYRDVTIRNIDNLSPSVGGDGNRPAKNPLSLEGKGGILLCPQRGHG